MQGGNALGQQNFGQSARQQQVESYRTARNEALQHGARLLHGQPATASQYNYNNYGQY